MGTRMGASRARLAWAMAVGLALGGADPVLAHAEADEVTVACASADEGAEQAQAGEADGSPTSYQGQPELAGDAEEPPGDSAVGTTDGHAVEGASEELTDEVVEVVEVVEIVEIVAEEVEPCEVKESGKVADEGVSSSDGTYGAREPTCSDGVVTSLGQGTAGFARGAAEGACDDTTSACGEEDAPADEPGREAVRDEARTGAPVHAEDEDAGPAHAARDTACAKSADEADAGHEGREVCERSGADVPDAAAGAGPRALAEALEAASVGDAVPAGSLVASDGTPLGCVWPDVQDDARDVVSEAARHGWRVSFEANCAPDEVTGTMDDLVVEAGDMARVPACGFERSGCAFVCWCTEPEGVGRRLVPGEELGDDVPPGSAVTLYALWEAPQLRVVVPVAIGLAPTGDTTLAGPVAEAAVSNASAVSVALEEVSISGAGWELVETGEVREPSQVALALAFGQGPERDLADAAGPWGRVGAGDELEVRTLTMEVDETRMPGPELPSLTFRIATCAE